jgi:hypothetical protein
MENVETGENVKRTPSNSLKNFFDPQNWKIMGAAMGAHNVLHHK